MIIKNVFIPEKFGSYYIFRKRVLGLDIGKTQVNITQLLFKGRAVIIEKYIEVPLDAGTAMSYDERALKTLTTALEQVDPYDAVCSSISSSLVVFKELRLPFLDHNKIRQVVEFEVEPLLPFAISDAVIDFIVTRQHREEKSSEVLIAAVQKQHIAHHINLLSQAHINPDVITIDLLALYGVFTLIPAYSQLPGGTILIDIGAYTTGIAYIQDGQLRLIRTLAKGTVSQAKTLAQALHLQPGEAMEEIVRFGLEKNNDPEYQKVVTSIFTDFWQDIALTLNSFAAQTEYKQSINQILLLGLGADIKELSTFATKLLGFECEQFQIHKLLQNNTLKLTTKNSIPQGCVISLCTALSAPVTKDFNLCKKEFRVTTDTNLLTKQVIAALALFVLIIGLLLGNDIIQLRKLNNLSHAAEIEVINTLKKQFKNIPRDEDSVENAINTATNEVRREEKLWFAIANPSRVSFLQYLLELTSKIDKESLGFTIDRLIITESSITMTAHVRDHAALVLLEKELRQSKLFTHVEGQDQPDFTMKIRLA